MVKHRLQAPVTRRHVVQGRGQQIQTTGKLSGNFCTRHHRHPARRQFDAHRHSLQQSAEPPYLRPFRRQAEIGLHPLRSLHKQPHRLKCLLPKGRAFRWIGQSFQFQQPFHSQIQSFPRGDQQLELGRRFHHFQHQVSSAATSVLRRKQVLHVVQHQEQVLLAEEIEELLLGLFLAVELEPQGVDDGDGEQFRRIEVGEGDKGDVGKEADLLGRNLERQTRLANASGSGEGHQPTIGIGQKVRQRCQVLFPADQGRARDG